jgi:hypothetical protein
MADIKNRIVKFCSASCLVFLLINTACKAPRDNPLDVNNPDNQIAILDGYVRTVSLPRTAIANAKILFEAAGVATVTDNNGYFSFRSLNLTSGWVKISA